MPFNVRHQPVYLQSGDPETENVPVLAYPGELGDRFGWRSQGSPGIESGRYKVYQLVGTDSGMAVGPYDSAVAWWADKTKFQVTTDNTKLGRGRIAGVFVNAITPGNFGCIQVSGPAEVKFIDGVTVANVIVAGNFVIPSATAGKADVIAAGSSPTYPTLGVTAGILGGADQGGGSSTAIVDLDIPETP